MKHVLCSISTIAFSIFLSGCGDKANSVDANAELAEKELREAAESSKLEAARQTALQSANNLGASKEFKDYNAALLEVVAKQKALATNVTVLDQATNQGSYNDLLKIIPEVRKASDDLSIAIGAASAQREAFKEPRGVAAFEKVSNELTIVRSEASEGAARLSDLDALQQDREQILSKIQSKDTQLIEGLTKESIARKLHQQPIVLNDKLSFQLALSGNYRAPETSQLGLGPLFIPFAIGYFMLQNPYILGGGGTGGAFKSTDRPLLIAGTSQPLDLHSLLQQTLAATASIDDMKAARLSSLSQRLYTEVKPHIGMAIPIQQHANKSNLEHIRLFTVEQMRKAVQARFTPPKQQKSTFSIFKKSDKPIISGVTGYHDQPGFQGIPFPIFEEEQRLTLEDLDKLEAQMDTIYTQLFSDVLMNHPETKLFFRPFNPEGSLNSTTLELSSGVIRDATSGSFKDLRQDEFSVNATAFKLNGYAGDKLNLNLPVTINLKGSVESSKSIHTTGSIATKFGNTLVGMNTTYINTGSGFNAESRHTETSVMVAQQFGAAFAEVQLGSVNAKDVNKADFNGSRTQLTLGVDTTYITPFVQLTHRNLDRQGTLFTSNVLDTTVALGAEVGVAHHQTDAYVVDVHLTGKVGYNNKRWTALGRHLGTDTDIVGSFDMTGALKLNTGLSFSSHLSFGSAAGTSVGLSFTIEH